MIKLKGALPEGYLTAAEMIVLREIALGRGNRNISADLGVSIKTTEKHRANIQRKLGTHGTADLTRVAIELGVITLTVTPLERAFAKGHERWVIPQRQLQPA